MRASCLSALPTAVAVGLTNPACDTGSLLPYRSVTCVRVAASSYGVFGIHTFVCQGVYTGSVYVDNDLTRMGFAGEGVKNFTVMAVKDHGPVTFKRYNKVC